MFRFLPLALLALTFGCGDPVTPPTDAGVDANPFWWDGSTPFDGGGRDGAAGTDGGPRDGGGVPDDPYVPVPALPEFRGAALAALQAELDDLVARREPDGAVHSIQIVDLETGQELYARNPTMTLIPASNTKLFTTALALDALGPDWTPAWIAFASAPDESGRVLSLDVQVDFDPSSSSVFFATDDFATERFARRIRAAGVSRVQTSLFLFGYGLYDAYNFGTYDADAERPELVDALDRGLRAAGVTLESGSTTRERFSPSGPRLVAWEGAPLLVQSFRTNSVSHNELADMLCTLLGRELRGDPSYAAGNVEMAEFAEDVTGITGARFGDGSGLSRENRVSAAHVVGLFAAMRERPVGERWLDRLSLAGNHGTLAERLTGAETSGRFYGKTGTLNGVIATSGVLHHWHDGRRYAFGMLMNEVSDAGEARAMHDALVAAVATNRRGVNAAAAPVLLSVRALPDGRLQAEWTGVAGAEGYVLEISADGRSFPAAARRYVTGTRYAWNARESYVRVRARSGGVESKPSDTYGARVGGSQRLLLVDGNDRWEDQPTVENPRGANHAFLVEYAEVLGERWGFDSAENAAVVGGDLMPRAYDALAWSLGEESVDRQPFDAAERALVQEYVAAGGHLIVSGAEVAWALEQAGGEAATFLRDVLGVRFVADEAGTFVAEDARGADDSLGELVFRTPGAMDVRYADVLDTVSGEVVLRYVGGAYDGRGAAVRSGNVFVVGFPIESVDRASTRRTLLEAALP